jgi:adenosylcobinamide-GDP ribazoletransferase
VLSGFETSPSFARLGVAEPAMRLPILLLTDLIVCLRFFSRLRLPPLGSESAPHSLARLVEAVRMLPLAGAVLGSLAALVLVLGSVLGLPSQIAAALAIGALVLLTGALHEDGLADCADSLGGTSRERRLEIMRDSRIGTYGAAAIALTLYVRVESLAAILTRSALLAAAVVIFAAAVSRTAALVPSLLLPPARADGCGRAFRRPEPFAFATAVGIASLSALLPVLAGGDPGSALTALAAALGLSAGATKLADRLVGGHSGDIAGAVQQLTELAVLVAFAAG